jgi:hypothetical protein
MKTLKIAVAAAFTLSMASAAFARDLSFDFDGAASGRKLKAGSEGITLAGQLSEAPGLSVPKWDVPPANGPECVDSPYGCPGTGGGGSDNGSDNGSNNGSNVVNIPIPGPSDEPFYLDKPFIGAVCVNTGSYGAKCFNETGRQSTLRLSKKILDKAVHNEITERLTVKFPYAMSKVKIIEALVKLELETVKEVNNQLSDDLKNLMPMPWATQAEKERNLRIIQTDQKVIKLWSDAARAEAMNNSNWQTSDSLTYSFQGGPAYQQLGQTLIGKEFFK